MSPDISGKANDGASLKNKYSYQPFVKHEHEELIARLCRLDDPKLKKIGYEELGKIRAQQRGVSILDRV